MLFLYACQPSKTRVSPERRRPLAGAAIRASLLALLVPLALAPAGPAHADRVTGFDTGLEFWQITGDNDSFWQATGGNPGGCFNVNDLAIGSDNFAVAPPSWLGDWRSMGTADSILVDYHFTNTSGGAVYSLTHNVHLMGPGGIAKADSGYVPPQGAWTTYGIALDPARWTVVEGTWSGLMANVTTVLIHAEFVNGEEVVLLDNIRLTGDPVPVFEACEKETFTAAGTGDWSFQDTGGVSNPGSGGNRGGYCEIADAAGTSYAFAPSRFLGDWTALDGTGEVSIDIRLVSRGGPVIGAAEFIRLSGPGGTASVALAPGDIPAGGMVWKRFTYPLSAAAWTVTSGTWAGLLANVTECRLTVEWVSGTETTGFDNFTRRSAICPAIDDPVTTHVADVTECGYLSHVGIAAIARNAADGLLYGTVSRTSGTTGGLYRASGDSAGVRLQAYTNPTALICDTGGNVFVSDASVGNVYRRTPGGTWSTWVSGFHTGDDDPSGMCFAPAGFTGPSVVPGDILVTDYGFSGPDEIWAFSPLAAEGERLVVPDPGETDIRDLTTGPAGVVYAADEIDSTRIYRVTPAGALVAIPLSQPVGGILSLVYDDVTAQVYVASLRDRTIRRIDPATGAVQLVASGFTAFSPSCLEIDGAARKLWAADSTANRIYEFCLASGATSVSGGSFTGGDAGAGGPVSGTLIASMDASPNPARAEVTIRLALSRDARSTVEVFDISGRLVREIHDARLAAGERILRWDGNAGDGRPVAAGIYMIRVIADGESRATRAIIAR